MNGPAAEARGSDASKAGRLLGIVALLALWLLHRPYPGVVHDARIYMGNALAALNPGGIGQDLVFRLDEQSRFSLFQPVVTATTDAVGLQAAAFALTLVGLTAWFGGAWVLTRALATGRTRWAALVCVIALPARYAVVELFSYAEAFVTPRLFAEAAALAGLGFFLHRRPLPAALLLGAALALHPLMGLPAAGAVLVMLAMRSKKWLVAAAAGLLAVVVGALVGLPLAGRLFTTFDPEWISQLRVRNGYIFPSLWEQQAFSRLAVQATTVAFAASLSRGRVRDFLHAVALVGVGGTAASVILADWLQSVLAAQLQLWRGLWILAVVAAAGLAITAVRLWQQGPGGRLVLPFLGAAWVLADATPFAVPLLAAAAIVYRLHVKGSLEPGRRTLLLAWSALGLTAAALLSVRTVTVTGLVSSARRAGVPLEAILVLNETGAWLLLAALVIGWAAAHARPRVIPAGGLAAVALALVVAAAAGWDARSPYQRVLEKGAADPPIAHLIDEDDPAVPIVWVEETVESWTLAGRPSWGAAIQGAGGVFSRELALAAEHRISTLIDLRLASPNARDTFANQFRQPARPTAGSIRAACDLQPPVAAVVVPGPPPQPFSGPTWIPPNPAFVLRPGDGWKWERFDKFTVINCR